MAKYMNGWAERVQMRTRCESNRTAKLAETEWLKQYMSNAVYSSQNTVLKAVITSMENIFKKQITIAKNAEKYLFPHPPVGHLPPKGEGLLS